VRVWKWYTVRPVINTNGYSELGRSCGGTYSAALMMALPKGFMDRYSSGCNGAPVIRSLP